MKIYILTDLEGVGGVVNRTYTRPGDSSFERAREWLTLEVNAAVDGALEGGATEILVLDGHGAYSACNMLYEKMHRSAKYIQGVPWTEYLECFDETFDGLLQIGAHAMAGTPAAVLEHTMSSDTWVAMKINGRPMGEIGLGAAVAGHFGVPFVMVSGDDKACRESLELVPEVETAITKYGISRHCARLLPMSTVHAEIHEKARLAVSKIKTIQPFRVDAPLGIEIEIEYFRNEIVEAMKEREGVKKITARKVVYSGSDIIAAYNHVRGG